MGLLVSFPKKQRVSDGWGADDAAIKLGGKFKDKNDGKVYVVEWVGDHAIILQTEDGLGRMLTGHKDLKRTCLELRE
jgi:hypothetical protein